MAITKIGSDAVGHHHKHHKSSKRRKERAAFGIGYRVSATKKDRHSVLGALVRYYGRARVVSLLRGFERKSPGHKETIHADMELVRTGKL